MSAGKIMKSVCIFWNAEQNYGFIESLSGGKDYYVHESEIKMEGYRELSVGQVCQFSPHENSKGPVAINVIPGKAGIVIDVSDIDQTINTIASAFSVEECREIGVALSGVVEEA